MLKVDRVMNWLESETSQLLWVDGNQILQRQKFSASFVVPLLIFGKSSFETCFALRNFYGDCGSIRLSNFRTLAQSPLRQLLKQRPEVWNALSDHFTEEKARDISILWNVTGDGIDAKDFAMKELNDLVKESIPPVKILLTAPLYRESQTAQLSSRSLALKTLSSAATRRPQKSLSMHIMKNDMALVPQKLRKSRKRDAKPFASRSYP
ncbi:hypothetical protein QQZ08_007263 [Neonectria magnoliae]|uniref:Uncharacterized protein n=1 Tax=Neonectria magnoliae TaxID=2732573 RepID=A0ABR1HY56_9HYPO